MMEVIKARLDTVAVSTSWGDDNNDYWAKHIEVYLKDEKHRDEAIGEISYLLVCSKKFIQSPNEEVDEDDLRKALVMEKYDQEKLTSYLESKIHRIPEVGVDELIGELSLFLDVTGWEE